MNGIFDKIKFELKYLFFFLSINIIFFLFAGCANRIEEVTAKDDSPPEIIATLSGELKELIGLERGVLSAYVFLNKGESDEKSIEMDIRYSNGTANYVISKLDLSIDYNILVEFQYRSSFNPDVTLIIGTTEQQTAYQFKKNEQLRFSSDQLDVSNDYDNDTASNLAELLSGGNPLNPSPTFKSASDIIVKEGVLVVQNIEALSPITGAIIDYQITNGTDKAKFQIVNSVLSFLIEPKYDTTSIANNRYELEITASDGAFSSQQLILVTVTDSFYFSLNGISGLRSMNFNWDAQQNADYYKVVESVDGIARFVEIDGATNIVNPWFFRDISAAPYTILKNQFKVQAYDINKNLIAESAEQAFGRRHFISDIQTLKPGDISNGLEVSAYERFGTSLLLSANGSQLVVGAPYTDQAGNRDSGLVYVMLRSNIDYQWDTTVGSRLQLIGMNEALAGYRYGSSLAVSSNGANINTLAIGAPGADFGPDFTASTPVSTGAVYTYSSTGSLGSGVVYKAFAPDGVTGDEFGSSVALNGSGLVLVAGAPNAKVVGNNNQIVSSGAVYTFSRSDELKNWEIAFSSKLVANDTAYGDQFGSDVELSSDGLTLVVSSPRGNIDVGGVVVNYAGAVYIFNRTDILGTWEMLIKLISDEVTEGNDFGRKILLSEDELTLYVGEPSAAVNTGNAIISGAGAIHVFQRQGSNWERIAKLVDSAAKEHGRFGLQFSLSSDGSTIVVGAPFTDELANNMIIKQAGRALVFRRQNGGTEWNPNPEFILTVQDPAQSAQFGTSVAINSDGRNFIIGAPGATYNHFINGPLLGVGAIHMY